MTPALKRRDDILARYRRPIVKLKPVAQCKSPRLTVLADAPLLHHLGRNLTFSVHAKQGVVDHVAMVTGNGRGGPDGIEDFKVRLRDKSEYFLAAVLYRFCRGTGRQHEK